MNYFFDIILCRTIIIKSKFINGHEKNYKTDWKWKVDTQKQFWTINDIKLFID